MAGSLIPDVGNISANTTGAMQNYLSAVKDYGSSTEKPADTLNTYIKNMLDQKRIEEDMALKRSAESRAQTELGMQQAERDRINNERIATNNALQAIINPKAYGADKMAGEQKAIQASLANLSPEERVIAEQQIKANYDPFASEKGWLDNAINAKGVDVGKVFDAKNKDYEMKAKTPGTPEYIAAQNAAFDLYEKEQKLAHGFRMGEIGAQNANAIKLMQTGWDAPREMVDTTNGKTYYVKPSESDKYPSTLVAKDVYSTQVTNSRELQKQEYEKLKNEQKVATENKEKLAKTMGSLGNQDVIMSTVGNINSIAKSYGVDLTDVDINTSIEGSINGSRLDLGKPDAYPDLVRQKLASTIAAKSKKPLEEVLKKIEGKEESTSTSPSSGSSSSSESKPFSLFGITAPTEYNAVQNSSNYGIDPKVAAAKAKYDLLPEYIKKDVSLSKYMDRPSSYDYLLKK